MRAIVNHKTATIYPEGVAARGKITTVNELYHRGKCIMKTEANVELDDYRIYDCFVCNQAVWRFTIHDRIVCFSCMDTMNHGEAEAAIAEHEAEYARYERDGQIKSLGGSTFIFKCDDTKQELGSRTRWREEDEPR